MTVKDWHAVLRVNLSGAFYMIQAVLEHMLDRGFGRIINISSVVGETSAFGQANYAASKSGLHSGLSRSGGLRGHCPWLSACRAAKIPAGTDIWRTVSPLRMPFYVIYAGQWLYGVADRSVL